MCFKSISTHWNGNQYTLFETPNNERRSCQWLYYIFYMFVCTGLSNRMLVNLYLHRVKRLQFSQTCAIIKVPNFHRTITSTRDQSPVRWVKGHSCYFSTLLCAFLHVFVSLSWPKNQQIVGFIPRRRSLYPHFPYYNTGFSRQFQKEINQI